MFDDCVIRRVEFDLRTKPTINQRRFQMEVFFYYPYYFYDYSRIYKTDLIIDRAVRYHTVFLSA